MKRDATPAGGYLLAVLSIWLVTTVLPLQAHAAEPIRIGWAAWPSNEITAKIVARVLEDHVEVPVELVNLDVAPMYRGLAAGYLDVIVSAWLPTAHRHYLEEVGDDVVDLGILYDHARMGWVVPAHIPRQELRSIADLRDPAVRERLNGRIIGIEPGAGMTRISEQALQVYGLDGYELQVTSSVGMAAALRRAIDRDEWIVVNGWTPHWMWAEWDLRWLEDPEGLFGRFERIHVLGRAGFGQDRVELAAALGRMWIPRDELAAALERAQATSFDAAAAEYVERNPRRVHYWVAGEMP